MNLINVSFFWACAHSVFASSSASVKFLFLDRISSFDSTWCLLVISLITLICVVSASTLLAFYGVLFLLLFCLHLIFVLYLFVRQCWDIFMLCVLCLFYLWCAWISFIQSFWSDAQQTQIVNISWMANQVFVSSFFFSWFNSQIICKQVCACVRAYLFYFHSFHLESEGFSKTILFAFWIPFFPFYSTLFVYLCSSFFSSFNLEK